MTTIAEYFETIAQRIEEARADVGLTELFAQTRVLCENAAAVTPAAETQRLLSQGQQALKTWQEVWPRLGLQREFRLAVVREARLWAKRLAEAPSAS